MTPQNCPSASINGVAWTARSPGVHEHFDHPLIVDNALSHILHDYSVLRAHGRCRRNGRVVLDASKKFRNEFSMSMLSHDLVGRRIEGRVFCRLPLGAPVIAIAASTIAEKHFSAFALHARIEYQAPADGSSQTDRQKSDVELPPAP